MRGALVIVSPSDALAERVREMCHLCGALTIDIDADTLTEPMPLVVDPLGEIRVDNVAVALSLPTEEPPRA